jgi:hypothetical protein
MDGMQILGGTQWWTYLGQPQQQKMFCPGLIYAASGFLLPVFGRTGCRDGALTCRAWRTCCGRGTGLKKAEAATAQMRTDAEANGGSFELVALELASLKSVLACAEGLLKSVNPSMCSSQMQE